MIFLNREKEESKRLKWIIVILTFTVLLTFLFFIEWKINHRNSSSDQLFPSYEGKSYTVINENRPFFEIPKGEISSSENYSEIDSLGRCGVAFAVLSKETMPTEKRGKIGMIKPSGWHTIKYPDVIEDQYLFNRCHLIAWCLSGENANEKNLITGTRYMNTKGMLPFEERVAKYLDHSNNHVLYRVTPVFEENNLVASGVLMEAYSYEDQGKGICFCIYCYNVQPGIEIDYKTGESKQISFGNID